MWPIDPLSIDEWRAWQREYVDDISDDLDRVREDIQRMMDIRSFTLRCVYAETPNQEDEYAATICANAGLWSEVPTRFSVVCIELTNVRNPDPLRTVCLCWRIDQQRLRLVVRPWSLESRWHRFLREHISWNILPLGFERWSWPGCIDQYFSDPLKARRALADEVSKFAEIKV